MRTLLISLALAGLTANSVLANDQEQKTYSVTTSCQCEYTEDIGLIGQTDVYGQAKTTNECSESDLENVARCKALKVVADAQAQAQCLKKTKDIEATVVRCSTEVAVD